MSDTQLAISNTGNNFLSPATSLNIVLSTYQAKKEFIEAVLKDGVDYGKIPGTGDKPALLKPGAEKMVSFFGLSPVFEDVCTIEDWTGADHSGEPFFYYRQKCKLYSGTRLIATADGSCNSWEKKYRYRNSERVCPQCGKATLLKSKDKPEFFCWAKRGGCGATFPMNDKRITEQVIGQMKNPDVAELVNTILKMSQKRALVAVTLIATNASDYFTQDIEDYASQDVVDAVFAPVVTQPQQPPAPKPTNGNGHAPVVTVPSAPVLVQVDTVEGQPIMGIVEPITQSHNGEDYAAMPLAELTGRHTHYLKLSRDPKQTAEVMVQAKKTADYLSKLIEAKRAAK